MSRVQRVLQLDHEKFKGLIEGLLTYANSMADNEREYGNIRHVVFLGLSKPAVESYVRWLSPNNTIPEGVVCFGLDEPPNSHLENSLLGAHVVLMHDLRYADSDALSRIFQRLCSIIWNATSGRLGEGCLTVYYQNPRLWDSFMQWGGDQLSTLGIIDVQKGPESLASSVTSFEEFLNLGLKWDAKTVTVGKEYLAIHPTELLSRLAEISAQIHHAHKDARLVVAHELLPVLFEAAVQGPFITGAHQ